jgi:hypothetical protein
LDCKLFAIEATGAFWSAGHGWGGWIFLSVVAFKDILKKLKKTKKLFFIFFSLCAYRARESGKSEKNVHCQRT